ncbi:hypothetical protein Tco_1098235 [Tanacetum coccineum]
MEDLARLLRIKESKTDDNVEEFLICGYENKWTVDLYIEHFDYDVLNLIDFVTNVSEGSDISDEYYFSKEDDVLEYADFQTEGVFVNNNIPEVDPNESNIAARFKIKKGVSYPKFDQTNYGVANGYQLWYAHNDWKCILVQCEKDVEGCRCAGVYGKKKVQKKMFDDVAGLSDNEAHSYKKHERWRGYWHCEGSLKQKDGNDKECEGSLKQIEGTSIEKFMTDVSLSQCKRAKQRTLYDHEGGLVEHYGRLFDYRLVILDTNPGSTCRLDVKETHNRNA